MTPKVPTSAIGTVTLGITVAQKLRRNRKITITTRVMVSSMVNSTSETEAWMVWVRSMAMSTWIDGGIAASRRGRAFFTLWAVSMMLAPGCRKTASPMAGLLFSQAVSLVF